MKQTPLKPGTSRLQRVPFPVRTSGLARGELARTVPVPGVKSAATRKARTSSGEFPAKVKLQCRTRAGNGDPDVARCEATGVWLGRYGGEIQHRDARGMGGTSDPAAGSIVNAVLLSKEAHRLAESRDAQMNEEGFWLRNGQDPALTPILLHSEHGSGITAWLGNDGEYHFDGPQREAS